MLTVLKDVHTLGGREGSARRSVMSPWASPITAMSTVMLVPEDCSRGMQGRDVLRWDLVLQPDISADTTELDLLLFFSTGISPFAPVLRWDPENSLGAAPADCGKLCSKYLARRSPSAPAKYAR